MASYNKVILMGNLTRDPELRVTPSGSSICKLSLAVNRKYRTQDGQDREEVTYVDVDAFGRQGEVISKYLVKGRPLMMEGRLKLDQWQDKQTGQNRSRLGVVLESFQFVDSGRSGESSSSGGFSGGNNYEQTSPPSRPSSPTPPIEEPEDDIPF